MLANKMCFCRGRDQSQPHSSCWGLCMGTLKTLTLLHLPSPHSSAWAHGMD